MSQIDPVNAAANVLSAFMKEMNLWEVKFHTLYKRENGGPEKHGANAKEELERIYEKFVTAKDRKTGRLAGPSAGYPPEFDTNAEKFVTTEGITPKKVIIESAWTHPAVSSMTEQRRYTLLLQPEGWKVDKKEVFRKIKDKWENRVL